MTEAVGNRLGSQQLNPNITINPFRKHTSLSPYNLMMTISDRHTHTFEVMAKGFEGIGLSVLLRLSQCSNKTSVLLTVIVVIRNAINSAIYAIWQENLPFLLILCDSFYRCYVL